MNLRNYLRDHPIFTIFAFLAALATVITLILAAIEKIEKQPLPIDADIKSEKGVNYNFLKELLANENFRVADEQTARIVRQIFNAEKGKYITKEDIAREPFPCQDLYNIDYLWGQVDKRNLWGQVVRRNPWGQVIRRNQFGFTPQLQVWEKLRSINPRDPDIYNVFAGRVGWRAASRENRFLSLDELTYSLQAPDGHLPSGIGMGLRWNYGSFLNRMSQCNTFTS